MKKYLILVLIACFCFQDASAQKRKGKKGRHKGPSSLRSKGRGNSNGSMLIGVPGSLLSTWLVNPYFKEQPTGEQDYNFSLGYQGGILIGYEFSSLFSVHLSALYGMHQQKYSGRKKGSFGTPFYDYKSSSQLSMIEIPIFIQFTGASGGYFEAGAMYSMIQKATFKFTDAKLGSGTGDVNQYFPDSRISAVIGFGMDASLGGKWFLKIGFRGIYTFDDMIGVNAFGTPLRPILTKEPTLAASGGINIGLIFKPGY